MQRDAVLLLEGIGARRAKPLGLFVWSRIGQMSTVSPPQSRVPHGFSLIPVSGVLGPVDEDKTGGKAENSRTPKSHMVRGWDDFRETHRIAQIS